MVVVKEEGLDKHWTAPQVFLGALLNFFPMSLPIYLFRFEYLSCNSNRITSQFDSKNAFEFGQDLWVRNSLAGLIILNDRGLFIYFLCHILLGELLFLPGGLDCLPDGRRDFWWRGDLVIAIKFSYALMVGTWQETGQNEE
jgi:hypothetical protein